MPSDFVAVRQLHNDNTITYRLVNADGTEPSTDVPELPADKYPTTRLNDKRYNLDNDFLTRKPRNNLRWLSNHNPLLFEELLCLFEDSDEDNAQTIRLLLDHNLVPDRQVTESYINAYYRHAIDTTPLLVALAKDGYPGSPKRQAWSLFVSTRTACGYTVEYSLYKEAILAVWIMQDTHHSIKNPLRVKEHGQDMEFIHQRFNEVYELRHELRARNTIDSAVIKELLQHYGPLREGAL